MRSLYVLCKKLAMPRWNPFRRKPKAAKPKSTYRKRKPVVPDFEQLEKRWLFYTQTLFTIPGAQRPPLDITLGPDGNLWFTHHPLAPTDPRPGQIGRITTRGVVTLFPLPLPSLHATELTFGPDNNLWFTAFFANGTLPDRIGRVTSLGVITTFVLPVPLYNGLTDITAGPDGNLWYTASAAQKVGRVTTAGVITEFALPAGVQPGPLVTGPDGALWVGARHTGGDRLLRVTTTGSTTTFPLPVPNAHVTSIAAGYGGALWFTAAVANRVGRFVPGTNTFTLLNVPTPAAGLGSIMAGRDGNIWFTEHAARKIGQVRLGRLVEERPLLAMPGRPAAPAPRALSAGPMAGDLGLWFTDSQDNSIVLVTCINCQVGTDIRQRWPGTDLSGTYCPDGCQDGGRVRVSPNTGTFEMDQPLNYRAGPGRPNGPVFGAPSEPYSQTDAHLPRAARSGPRFNHPQGVSYRPAAALADHAGRDFGGDSYGGVGGQPALVFTSGSIKPKPIGEHWLEEDRIHPVTQIHVTLMLEGNTCSRIYNFNPPLPPTEKILIGCQLTPSPPLRTGVPDWRMDVLLRYADPPGGTHTLAIDDEAIIVARDNSPYGTGWDLDAPPRLLHYNVEYPSCYEPPCPDVVIMPGSGVRPHEFNSLGGGTYERPPGDFGDLTYSAPTYTYTTKYGLVWKFVYGSLLDSLLPSTVTDPHGLTVTYTLHQQQGMTICTKTCVTQPAETLVKRIDLPDGGITTFLYDPAVSQVAYGDRRLLQVIMPGGRTLTPIWTTGPDRFALAGIRDVDNSLRTFGYDAFQRLSNMQWSPLNVTFTYDSVFGYLKTIDRGLGSVTTLTQSSSVVPMATAPVGPDKAFGLVEDARGYVTTYLFQIKGWLTELQTTELGTTFPAVQKWERDDNGQIITYTNALGRVTTMSYGSGSLRGVTLPGGDRYSYDYGPFARLTRITDPFNRVTQFDYNSQGDVTTITNALNEVTTLAYYTHLDPPISNGLVKTITNPRGYTTTFTYWPDRRVQNIIDALEGTTSFSYQFYASSPVTLHRTVVRDALNRLTTLVHDPRGRLLRVTDAASGVSDFTYNAIGEITSRTDQLGRLTLFSYDQRGWNTAITEGANLDPSAPDRRTTTITYDLVGNVATVRNGRDVVTAYGYDPVNRVNSVVEASSVPAGLPTLNHGSPLTQYFYDKNGNLLSMLLPNGSQTTYAYDERDRLITIKEAYQDPLERTTVLAWDKVDNLLSVKDPRNVVTSFLYDALDRVKEIRQVHGTTGPGFDALGHAAPITTIQYDTNGNVWWVKDPRGFITSYVYDQLDRPIRIIEALGVTNVERQTTYAYDAVHNLIGMTDPRGVRTSFAYDSLNRLESITEGLYTPGPGLPALGHGTPITTFVYDAASRLLSVADPRDIKTTFAYDALDRVITAIEAYQHPTLARTTQYQYDKQDNLIGLIDPRGVGATFVYDALDRLAYQIDAASGTSGLPTLNHASPITTYVYDIHSNLLGIQNARGVWTSFTYDVLDRNTAVRDALNRWTTFTYDAADNLLSVRNARDVVTSFAYDALYRVARVLEAYSFPTGLPTMPALGHASPVTTTYLYDIGSNVIATVDPLSQRTSYAYDALNRHIQTEDARNGLTTVGYDAADNVINVRDAFTPTNWTTFEYDGLNRQVTRTDPLNKVNTYVYDIASRLTGTIDRRSLIRDFAYDDLDRLTTQVWKTSAGTPVNTLVYSYDANDNLREAANQQGLYSFTYDGLNRVATQRDVWALLLTFTYDKVDNRIKVEDSKGGVVSSIYDTLDRLQTRELTQYGANVLKVDLAYTPTDQLESLTRSRWDVSAYAVAGTTSYIYDALERMASLQHKDGGGGSLAFYTYTYDLGSRVTSEKLNGVPQFTYTYDQTNQLTSDGTRGWGYDLIGNRNTTGYGHGPGNRLLTDSQGWSYKYDGEGNRTTKSLGLTTYTYLYGYDHNNQMVWAERRTAEAGGTLLMRADYKYDVFGRRIEAAVDPDGDGPSGTSVTRFAWDGAALWADLDSGLNVQTRYVHGDMVDQLFARVSGAGVVEWYLTDRLGSVRHITTAAGAVQYTATYDPYGNVIGAIDDLFGRHRLTGREYLAEVDLYDYRFRFYDARTGRFVSEDPIGFTAGDPNLYRYVGNSPTNATDPSGLIDPAVAAGRQATPKLEGLARPTCMVCHGRPASEQVPFEKLPPDARAMIMRWGGGSYGPFQPLLEGVHENVTGPTIDYAQQYSKNWAETVERFHKRNQWFLKNNNWNLPLADRWDFATEALRDATTIAEPALIALPAGPPLRGRIGIRMGARHFPNGASDDFARLAGQIPNKEGYFDLYIHTNNKGTVLAQLGAGGKSTEVADMLAIEKTMKAAGWDGKQPIRLIGCRAGDPALGKRAAAQQVADFFNMKVLAPTEDIVLFENGIYVITNKVRVTPTTPSTGSWVGFGK